MKKKDRYFIVFWRGIREDRRIEFGSAVIDDITSYPNYSKLHRVLSDFYSLTALSITNIIELTETDYNEWVREN